MKMVINGNLVCCWVFFLFTWRPFQPNLFRFLFSFGILDTINFELALFVATEERAFNTWSGSFA